MQLLKEYDSFLGFTNGKKEPGKTNTEKALRKRLDYLIDGKHQIMERRDFVLHSVLYGCSIVCQKMGGKREYRIYDTENTYSIITKIEYDFAEYIKKYHTSIKEILEYLEFETAIKKAQKQEAEREEQRKREEAERAEREEAEKREWLRKSTLEYSDQNRIDLVKSCYKELYNLDKLPLEAYEIIILIENIADPFCKANLIDRLHSSNKASRRIFEEITGQKLPQSNKDMAEFINSYKSDNNINVTDTYYIRWSEKGKLSFKPVEGEYFTRYGLEMFIHVVKNGEIGISFIRSGCQIVCGKDKETALSYFDDLVNAKNAEAMKHHDNILADKYGVSPYCSRREN